MKMSCIIIDDEQPAREELEFLLTDFNDVQIVAQAESASKAVQSIHEHEPDFIFLDIQLSGRSGFDVLQEIGDIPKPPLVVFITAYDQYAVQAFEENAIDYVLKPFSEKRLEQSLNRVRQQILLRKKQNSGENKKQLVETAAKLGKIKKISVERHGRMMLIDPDDIMFCQYKDKKILVHTRDDIYTLYGIPTMDQLELHLKRFSFFRSHRNTIINFDHIQEFSPWFHGKYMLTMADRKKTELTIPRERVKLFKEILGI